MGVLGELTNTPAGKGKAKTPLKSKSPGPIGTMSPNNDALEKRRAKLAKQQSEATRRRAPRLVFSLLARFAPSPQSVVPPMPPPRRRRARVVARVVAPPWTRPDVRDDLLIARQGRQRLRGRARRRRRRRAEEERAVEIDRRLRGRRPDECDDKTRADAQRVGRVKPLQQLHQARVGEQNQRQKHMEPGFDRSHQRYREE